MSYQAIFFDFGGVFTASPFHAITDFAIQIHGGGGVCQDFPLAAMFAGARALRLADGPDEVHLALVARAELAKYQKESREQGNR